MIEIYLLEQLDAFASCGTLSEAADKLHMTQPTLTRSMQKLEDYFGFRLFVREKKHLYLNEAGKLLARYAAEMLEREAEMERHIRSFNRSLNTLNIGSVAPGPLMVLLPRATALYPNITITSITAGEEELVRGLMADEYGIIILTRPLDDSSCISRKYIREHLNLSVSIIHPAASRKSVTFAEMNRQNFLMLSQVGVWEEIVRREMPDSHFYKQESMEALSDLTRLSELPSFSTNITLQVSGGERRNRANIPFSDDSAELSFYLVCRKSSSVRWRDILAPAAI